MKTTISYELKRHTENTGARVLRSTIYAGRPVLAAEWVLSHRTPESVALADLRKGLDIPENASEKLDELLTGKTVNNEDFITHRSTELDRYLTESVTSLRETRSRLPEFTPDHKLVNAFFREIVAA